MVTTEIIKINFSLELESQLIEAVELLKSGEIVAIPTETVYGLAANALDQNAVMKIFKAKGRPSDNPLIVHVSDIDMLYKYVDKLNELSLKLIDTFFPGPLTLILKKSEKIPYITTGGLDTVAIRMPSNEIALNLIKILNKPLAAPSANLSGKPSPTNANDVFEDLQGKIKLILDGGSTEIGLESTVIDISDIDSIPVILRPGIITKEEIENCLGIAIQQESENKSLNDIIKSPGMKYRHYAPNADLILFNSSEEINYYLANNIEINLSKISLIIDLEQFDKLLLPDSFNDTNLYVYSSTQELAVNLYSKIRELDRLKVDTILVQFIPSDSLGRAIYNRLKKSSVQI